MVYTMVWPREAISVRRFITRDLIRVVYTCVVETVHWSALSSSYIIHVEQLHAISSPIIAASWHVLVNVHSFMQVVSAPPPHIFIFEIIINLFVESLELLWI